MAKHISLVRLAADEHASTVIEFAAVAPVLCLLLMGAMDTGYQLYARAILSGEMQKAGRDSSLEDGSANAAALDATVEAAVKNLAKDATVTFTRKSYRTFSDAAAAQAEDFTDSNSDGICNNGELYEDANNNNEWDADGGASGQGGAKDTVVYTATVTYPRLFPLATMLGVPADVTMTSSTVLSNQPYGDQDESPPTARNCT